MNYYEKAQRYTGLPNYPLNGIRPMRIDEPDFSGSLVSLSEAKTHMRIEHDDDDLDIESYIEAATAYIESTTGRSFSSQQKILYFSHWPIHRIFNLGADVSSIESIQYYGSNGTIQTVSSGDYNSEGDLLVMKRSFSCPGLDCDRLEPVFVTANFQSENRGAKIAASAIKLLVHHLYEMRTPVVSGIGVTINRVPHSIDMLLESIRLRRL